MITMTLDSLVRRYLFGRGYSLHFYMTALGHAEDILGMLSLNILGNVKTVRVTPDPALKHIPLPADFVDLGRVSIYRGQILVQSIDFGAISRLFNTNDAGDPIPYDSPTPLESDRLQLYFASNSAEIMDYNYTDKGEFLGRQFGNGASMSTNTMRFLPQERRIQFAQALADGEHVEMSYISSDNFFSDTAIVPSIAKDVMEAGMDWKFTARKRGAGRGEIADAEFHFWNMEKHYRARRYPLSISSILQAVRRGYKQTFKS